MDTEQPKNSTLNETKPKVVSISKKKKIAKISWTNTQDQKPPELTLVVMAYLEEIESDMWGEDDTADWHYTLGFYDDRGFWINDQQLLMPSPLKWALITDPDKND